MTNTELSTPHSDTVSPTDMHPNINPTDHRKATFSGQPSLTLKSVANVER
ncbi:MAG: hypothetical protein J07HQW2_00367 [Haloquadratum walsbyi J07HQW2]|uniref:Uncharacterized protein n=1 Tax=Haloquadratum walsbyi J07HQW2 TaxID=1238425 RepID=U1NBD6_9EURY|nr:MAG: hypothetical protein J07HQW2_00367 [Haloquadratum walsbyi J07HQW2]